MEIIKTLIKMKEIRVMKFDTIMELNRYVMDFNVEKSDIINVQIDFSKSLQGVSLIEWQNI